MIKKNQKYIAWKDWEEEFGVPDTGTLKYMLLNRSKTGFGKCVRHINSRLYLDIKKVFDFIENSKDTGENQASLEDLGI
jgi:hypothetical protein